MKKKIVKSQGMKSDPFTELKAENPEIQKFIVELKAENLKLQKQIAKFQAKDVTSQNRIKVLETEQYRPKAQLIIKGLHDEPPKK